MTHVHLSPPDVPVPPIDRFPVFRTAPKTFIAVTEEDNIGVMACSIQRNDAGAPLQIVTKQAMVVVEEFEFTPARLPSMFGYEYIPKTNLLFNLTAAKLDNQYSFTAETYYCLLEGSKFNESTTFVLDGKCIYTCSFPYLCNVLIKKLLIEI